MAETPEAAGKMIKEKYTIDDLKYWNLWGNYDVTIKRIVLDKPRIILNHFWQDKEKEQ
ncbi:MAG: hypothetical protein ABFD00_01610 [Chloroherpetonaceae bacterium]